MCEREEPLSVADSIHCVVVVPTYNERENLARLTKAILRQGRAVDVLIIDDSSPDGTGQLACELSRQHSRVHFLSRPGKLGLGTAHIAGFRWALGRTYERIITMDADFSHPPERIPALLERSRRCDVVLGSRYVPGGGWKNWPGRRVILSSVANWMARWTLRLSPKDCTGAFRCFRRSVLEAIPFEKIHANGFAFQEEMLWQCSGRGWQICEVPIVFSQRTRGTSKISFREVAGAICTLARLMFAPESEKRMDPGTAVESSDL